MCVLRAEGSSKVQSRLEQQTSRLSQAQQIKSGSSSSSKAAAGSKSSPPKEKMSPAASPMDDIERGNQPAFFGTSRPRQQSCACTSSQWVVVRQLYTMLLFPVHRADGGGAGHGPDEQRRQLLWLPQLLLQQRGQLQQQRLWRGGGGPRADLTPEHDPPARATAPPGHAHPRRHHHLLPHPARGRRRPPDEHAEWVLPGSFAD